MKRRLLTSCLITALLSIACGGEEREFNTKPVFESLTDHVVAVNTELRINLRASDADNDQLRFFFGADIPDINQRARIDPAGANTAIFKWTPLASDVGLRAFDFSVSDGSETTKQTIQVDVRAAVGASTSPRFVRPKGSGTALDLGQQKCMEIDVEVLDDDSPAVDIKQENELLGSDLQQLSGLSAKWSWCPSDAQIEADSTYELRLSADDGDNPAVMRDPYQITLLKPTKPGCPGEAPVVTHTPKDENTIANLTVTAKVTEDMRLKGPPLFLYAEKDPGSPPNLSEMSQVSMVLLDGTENNGTWGADVPNPVASAGMGATADIYYLMIVNDDDDAEGDCDHRTQAPEKGTYKMTVTNSGGSGGQGLCESCSTDAQCGGPNDTCFLVGSDPYCGRACSGGDCGSGYECSATDITSVDGKTSRQCVPTSQSCGGSTTVCVDDMYEDNDDVTQVMSTPPLTPGSISAVMCNGADGSSDHDWFPFEVADDTEFTVTVAGGSESDIDLFIRDSAGMPVDGVPGSLNSGSAESITACLATGGRYYFRTRSYFKTNGATNPYTLSWSKVAKTCNPPPMCMDDMYEDDDNASQAYEVNPTPFMSADYPFDGFGQSICSWDEDWYKLNLPASQDVKVTLKFMQSTTNEDLDLLLYRGTTLLTPCNEFVPDDCDPNNGQSSSANEIMRFNTETSAGEYFVVVRGWNGAENTYDLCIGLNDADCPDPT